MTSYKRVGLYVGLLPLADARGKTSLHKGLPLVKTIYTYGFHELFLKYKVLQVIKNETKSTTIYITWKMY
jgi:hypothetical protein